METTINTPFISLYALAQMANVNPQSLYNLARMGYLPASKIECSECGKTSWKVSREDGEKYLAKRAAKASSK